MKQVRSIRSQLFLCYASIILFTVLSASRLPSIFIQPISWSAGPQSLFKRFLPASVYLLIQKLSEWMKSPEESSPLKV